jgi:hypothetical protein
MAAAILTRWRSLDGARRRGWGELKTGRNKRSFFMQNQSRKKVWKSAPFLNKSRETAGFVQRKRVGEQEGYCKRTL